MSGRNATNQMKVQGDSEGANPCDYGVRRVHDGSLYQRPPCWTGIYRAGLFESVESLWKRLWNGK